ncbi:CHASE2 domain-containing protein [Natronospira bacteriovora]|uniref:Adenylate/guanylate cyclase domain-containing protein n=1 Tax=Natronospira bacteriovora TaxID=3069753 RepID=A0ABU0W7P2_9GAMM|nr:adenylate/guanylate cyclase domain-containing protein [Natronospira sp. AB-CW4]MDQ2070055.1 adenylate/guanylate cyclase domain-containing protein [Natronospira sp. AB-CW4]
MQLSRHRKQLRWLLLIGLISALLVMAVERSGGLQRLEWISYDARVKALRADAAIPDELALILIDEASLAQLNPILGRFPWPRSVYADLLDFLSLGHPRAVVFDILLTENQWLESGGRHEPSAEDQALMMATAAAGNVHHAIQIITEQPDEGEEVVEAPPLPESVRQQHALNGVEGITDFGRNSVHLPIDGLHQMSAGLGAVGLDADDDGVYRRVRPFFRYRDDIFPALSVTALRDLGLEAARQSGRHLELGDWRVPVGEDGRVLANFYGEIPSYSIGGVFDSLQRLHQGEPERMIIDPEEFRDRIVFIGGSAVGLHDIKHTPLSSRTPGVEIHMSLAGNLLEGDFLRPVTSQVTGLLVLVYALLAAAAFMTGRVSLQLLLPLMLILLHVSAAWWAFSLNWVLDMAAPLGSVVLSGVACLAYVSVTEGRDKRRVRRMLSQYVSPAVLAEVVDRYDQHLSAEVGTAEQMSILFSDIRGFTGISENYPPEQVVSLLNRYLSVQTEAIFEQEGTLDKFIGDAIMAFWGAPIRVEDHARRAVRAALAMQRCGEQLNQQLIAEGWPPLNTGIGVHTGSVVLGNIGSDRKLDYTVIGDNVNLASRIEGLTSHYHCPVLISETTRAAAGDDVICALVDRVRVKGKEKAIAIWRPLASGEDDPRRRAGAEAIRDVTETAWEAYLARDWEGAARAWGRLPEDDPLRRIFLARCRHYMYAAPDPDWDGVHRLDSK